MKLFITLIFLATFTANSSQLSYQFVNFGVNEGLPSTQIYEIVQDSKGYIWFGTDRGLVSFNGYNFKVYTVKDGLSTNVVFKLDFDDEGRLFCYGIDRKIHFLINNRFVEFKYNKFFTSTHTAVSNLLSFDVDEHGFSYYVSDVTPAKASEGHLNLNGTFKFKEKQGIHISTVGNGTISSLNGFICDSIFIDDKYVCKAQIINSVNSVPFVEITKFKNDFFFSVGSNLYTFNKSNSAPTALKIIENFNYEILDLKCDQHGNLFIGTRNGLWKMPAKDDSQFVCILPSQSVSNILIDNQNAIWAATLFEGLYYCRYQEIKRFFEDSDEIISSMTENNDTIYFLTDKDNLYRFEKSDTNYNLVPFYTKLTPKQFAELSLRNTNFSSELFNMGVFLNHEKKCYFSYQLGARDFFSSKDYFYLMSRVYVSVYDKYLNLNDRVNYTYEKIINCGHALNDNTYLMGSEEGVIYHKDEDKGPLLTDPFLNYNIYKVQNYRPDQPFFRSKMRDIEAVNDSILVFGSAELGIYIERIGSTDLWIQKKHGLVSDQIEKLYVKDDVIVGITKEGISVISQKFGILNYTVKNGLLSNNVYDVIIYHDQLYVATDKGLSIFDVKFNNKSDLPIYLTSIKIDEINQPLIKNYEMDYSVDILDITFEGISHQQYGEINYKYQLRGVDKNWVKTSSTTVRYANLPYGEFEFWISGQKSNETWTNPVKLFQITRDKPFWEKNWFKTLIFISLIIVLLILFNVRYQRLKRLQEDKIMMLNMERKTLQAQMNPHFIFNSLTSLQSLIIDDKKIESQEYLAKFARLTRVALSQSTTNSITLKEEIELLKLFIDLERIRHNYKFNFEIISELQDMTIEIPPMIVQPFVENAIKHGLASLESGGLLTIVFSLRDETSLNCSVTDNGVGRSMQPQSISQRKSYGIQLVQERLVIMLNKPNTEPIQLVDLFSDGKPNGTSVKIIIPISTPKI
jgi:two-component sensor histidine kinase